MRRFLCLGFLAATLLSRVFAADPLPTPLAGSWRYDPDRSTELSGWQTLQLVIAVDGPRVTLTRQYAAGRRTYEDVEAVDLSKTVNVVTADSWPDNRHIGAYLGGDKTKKIKFRVFNDGRLLRMSADFVLATQQGEYAANVLRNYKVSTNGSQLTLTELRNTRDDPIIYIFQRVTDAGSATTKGHTN